MADDHNIQMNLGFAHADREMRSFSEGEKLTITAASTTPARIRSLHQIRATLFYDP